MHIRDVRCCARSSCMEFSLEYGGTRPMRGFPRSLGEGVLHGWGQQVRWGLARLSRCVPRFTLSITLLPLSYLFLTRVYECMCAPTIGDPLRYHSHFVATVQASPSAPLRPIEVVAHGRLGTATKKSHLLCGWDPESREVTYISIEWAGFG